MFTTRDGLGSDVVRAIAEDREGNLWLGTGGGGLNRLQDGKFTVFRKQERGLPSDDVSSVFVDGDGVVWVGTVGNGLARLDGGKWTRYTTREGLVSNFVGYLIEDGQGYLWIGSNAGLMRVQKKALNDFAQGLTTSISVRAYGKPDGLPTRECTQGSQPAACRTRSYIGIRCAGSMAARRLSIRASRILSPHKTEIAARERRQRPHEQPRGDDEYHRERDLGDHERIGNAGM